MLRRTKFFLTLSVMESRTLLFFLILTLRTRTNTMSYRVITSIICFRGTKPPIAYCKRHLLPNRRNSKYPVAEVAVGKLQAEDRALITPRLSTPANHTEAALLRLRKSMCRTIWRKSINGLRGMATGLLTP